MNAASALHWPRTLFARLTLILFCGLLLSQTLSATLTLQERDDATFTMMTGYIEREVAASVALLDRLPPAERSQWLPSLARRSYEFVLGPGVSGSPPDTRLSRDVAASMLSGLGPRYPATVNAIPGNRERFQVHLKLSDGSPLTIDVRPMHNIPLSGWLPLLLLVQLIVLGVCSWLAVRLVTRPLKQLAVAADALGPDMNATRLPEDGPTEVSHAAKAFNAMQDRISSYMTERIQILAAISHDLQTPITRMRLRTDLMDDTTQQAKLEQDLQELESLVREGVAYARTLHGAAEPPQRVDADALLDSMVCDYVDAGQAVSLTGKVGTTLLTRPQALRRILSNLIDNAVKFSGASEVRVGTLPDGRVTITVLDRGPGIPPKELDAVFQPFYRVESSRNRDSGGTGLGLAIARQLALAMNATLHLQNRPEGGLQASLTLPNQP
ncbi:sensor histidine kinase [Caballeronia glathei]|uniref:histidine kinase n=1 Tax=Caballeronia glathei TaxID=60547 RepID=A0A069PF88_9BURK|nr:HAMP domain-containing sensor histidine kinase [Caballeronia glathei]KDR39353.1 ATPase [Caballeronia glathei]CDY74948.1 sensor histidine kinase [Caballeronia glathei]